MSTLLDNLHTEPGRHHELLAANGQPHVHWQRFAELLGQLTPQQMQQRVDLVNRQIRENGVTYNIYGDSQGPDRSWRVSAVPNLIPAEEWAVIADGVAQRAGLLDAILHDLYGDQDLLRHGLLPTELIYGHPNFLWPCVGMQPVGGRFLHLYAVDIARAADGRWWVMSDRTQAPSGAGYALENRQVVARAFPTLYQQLGVRALTGFFQTLMHTLRQQAPTEGEPPLIVLLTSGRYNETYFEHVYLARHLGIPLVEGSDLSVRQPHVYLKTLRGLRRVHAILRRLDDDFCDPLELRGDSALGVPGLLAVARAGNVLIANALGTGVLESPGLLGFLPTVCEHLLGETLRLPSLATWWCGEPPVMEEALQQLDKLVIKAAYPTQHFGPLFGPRLDAAALHKLQQRIRCRPYAYLAQERLEMGQALVWDPTSQRFRSHACGMRVYAVASEQGYVVMPGGLSRVASSPKEDTVSMQRGGTSKDTWVCFSSRQREDVPQARLIGVRDLRRHDPFLPARIAENLFWLGRYAERCEYQARLIRSALARFLEQDPEQAPALLLALHHGGLLELLPTTGEIGQRLLRAIRSDSPHPDLHSTLRALIGSASEVRSRLSQENWIAIVELEQEAGSLDPEQLDPAAVLAFIDRLLLSLSALAGFALDDMTQDQSWHFLMLGRRLERLQSLGNLFAHTFSIPLEPAGADLDWLLEMGNSRITYRSRYLASAQLIPVLDLLLLDPSNPHALSFQIKELLGLLPRIDNGEDAGLGELDARLNSLDLSVIESDLRQPERLRKSLATLARLMTDIRDSTWRLADSVSRRHFAQIEATSHSLVSA